jgi:hypothetical protein
VYPYAWSQLLSWQQYEAREGRDLDPAMEAIGDEDVQSIIPDTIHRVGYSQWVG